MKELHSADLDHVQDDLSVLRVVLVPAIVEIDNGFIKASNSKLRAESLNAHWFMSLADAREKLEDWCRDYNEVRPHSAIGYNVPIAQHYPDGAASPSS